MRETLKTNISKYGPKINSSITVENIKGSGLHLVVIYAGKKHYLPLSSVPLSPDRHANHPNHQKIKVNHDGNVGIGASLDARLDVDSATNEDGIISEMTHSSYTNSAIFGNVTQSSSGSSNILRLRSASTDRMVVLDNGNVGIGTDAPETELHVEDTGGDAFISIEGASGYDAGIAFKETSETSPGPSMWTLKHESDTNILMVWDYSDSSVAAHLAAGSTQWVTGSDLRIKKDIVTLDGSLDSINALRPVTYKRKYGTLDKNHVGLIAQEVKPYFPLVVEGDENDFELLDPTEEKPQKYKGAMAIGYSSFVPYLIKAIQELSEKVTALENKGV